ncbi:MAG: hypothetical protein WC738_07285, partial [Candidatus Omnitrophota bacterium]
LDTAMDFYRTAEARNQAILRNTIKRMDAEGTEVAALITGGYHTKGISDLLKQKQTSYLVILPKFDSSKGTRPYVAILTNRNDNHHERVKSFFREIVKDTLDKAYKEGKNIPALKDRWIESYKANYEKLIKQGLAKKVQVASSKGDTLQAKLVLGTSGDDTIALDTIFPDAPAEVLTVEDLRELLEGYQPESDTIEEAVKTEEKPAALREFFSEHEFLVFVGAALFACFAPAIFGPELGIPMSFTALGAYAFYSIVLRILRVIQSPAETAMHDNSVTTTESTILDYILSKLSPYDMSVIIKVYEIEKRTSSLNLQKQSEVFVEYAQIRRQHYGQLPSYGSIGSALDPVKGMDIIRVKYEEMVADMAADRRAELIKEASAALSFITSSLSEVDILTVMQAYEIERGISTLTPSERNNVRLRYMQLLGKHELDLPGYGAIGYTLDTIKGIDIIRTRYEKLRDDRLAREGGESKGIIVNSLPIHQLIRNINLWLVIGIPVFAYLAPAIFGATSGNFLGAVAVLGFSAFLIYKTWTSLMKATGHYGTRITNALPPDLVWEPAKKAPHSLMGNLIRVAALFLAFAAYSASEAKTPSLESPAALQRAEPKKEALTPEQAHVKRAEFLNMSGASSHSVALDGNYYGANVGEVSGRGSHMGFSSPEGKRLLDERFKLLSDNGCKVDRIFLFGDLRGGLVFGFGDGPTGFTANVDADMEALFAAASKYKIKLIPVLFDFHLADGVAGNQVGEHPGLISDELKRKLLIDIFKPFIKKFGNNPNIAAWEIMNEPELAIAVAREETKKLLAEMSEVLRTTGKPVTFSAHTVGDFNYWKDLAKPGDILQLHWYDSVSQLPSRASLNAPKGVKVIIGELGLEKAGASIPETIYAIMERGYDGVLFWIDGKYRQFLAEIDLYKEASGVQAPVEKAAPAKPKAEPKAKPAPAPKAEPKAEPKKEAVKPEPQKRSEEPSAPVVPAFKVPQDTRYGEMVGIAQPPASLDQYRLFRRPILNAIGGEVGFEIIRANITITEVPIGHGMRTERIDYTDSKILETVYFGQPRVLASYANGLERRAFIVTLKYNAQGQEIGYILTVNNGNGTHTLSDNNYADTDRMKNMRSLTATLRSKIDPEKIAPAVGQLNSMLEKYYPEEMKEIGYKVSPADWVKIWLRVCELARLTDKEAVLHIKSVTEWLDQHVIKGLKSRGLDKAVGGTLDPQNTYPLEILYNPLYDSIPYEDTWKVKEPLPNLMSMLMLAHRAALSERTILMSEEEPLKGKYGKAHDLVEQRIGFILDLLVELKKRENDYRARSDLARCVILIVSDLYQLNEWESEMGRTGVRSIVERLFGDDQLGYGVGSVGPTQMRYLKTPASTTINTEPTGGKPSYKHREGPKPGDMYDSSGNYVGTWAWHNFPQLYEDFYNTDNWPYDTLYRFFVSQDIQLSKNSPSDVRRVDAVESSLGTLRPLLNTNFGDYSAMTIDQVLNLPEGKMAGSYAALVTLIRYYAPMDIVHGDGEKTPLARNAKISLELDRLLKALKVILEYNRVRGTSIGEMSAAEINAIIDRTVKDKDWMKCFNRTVEIEKKLRETDADKDIVYESMYYAANRGKFYVGIDQDENGKPVKIVYVVVADNNLGPIVKIIYGNEKEPREIWKGKFNEGAWLNGAARPIDGWIFEKPKASIQHLEGIKLQAPSAKSGIGWLQTMMLLANAGIAGIFARGSRKRRDEEPAESRRSFFRKTGAALLGGTVLFSGIASSLAGIEDMAGDPSDLFAA